MKKIEFVDLLANYNSIKSDIDNAIKAVITDTAFIGSSGNKYVSDFENKFSEYLAIRHTISCANGTDAIEIALKALDIKEGDEVIVPALTWISTAGAVVNIGATPVFVDINDTNYTINDNLIEEKITKKTKAIIAVHLYGLPANIDAIKSVCKKHDLFLIEDCAQAHGAEYFGKKVGTFGDISTFSFYPGKNLGCFGDGGAICTNNSSLAQISKQIANHGQEKKHNHLMIGRNSRLDGIQAAILSVKLDHLDQWNQLRINHANAYMNLIENKEILPTFNKDLKHVFHLFVIKHKNRGILINEFEKNNISFAIHYPRPISSLKIFEKNSPCPIAENLCQSIVSLPMYPELKQEELSKVSQIINLSFH